MKNPDEISIDEIIKIINERLDKIEKLIEELLARKSSQIRFDATQPVR